MDPQYKIYLDSLYECGSFYVFKKTKCGRKPYQDPNDSALVNCESEKAKTPSATTNHRKKKANNTKEVCIEWNDLLNDSELCEDYRNFLKCLRYPSNEVGITNFRYNNDGSFKCERGRRKEPIVEEQEEDTGADISDDDEGSDDDETDNEENMDDVYDDDDDDGEDECEDGGENEYTEVEDEEDKDIDTDDNEEEEDDDEDKDDDEKDVHDDEDEANRCTENSYRISISSIECNSFEARLQKETKRPFSQYEYDRLMRKATEHKAIVKNKVMRCRDKTYQTNVMGKSYFDHFPDVKAKVLAANKSKALELLRGFFFWLQNLCHEGSYQPWVGRPQIKRKLRRYK